MNVRGRHIPVVALAFVVLQIGGWTYGLSRNTTLSQHLALVVPAVVVVALWLAAVAVWHQRWAWWLYVIVFCIAVISPAWERGFDVVPYVVGVLTLALLVAPQMRRYVGVGRKAGTNTGTHHSDLAM